MPSLANLREEYRRERLDEADAARDPITQFEKWFEQARKAELVEPNAMALATADADGAPNVRMVLLKAIDLRGLTFFTDYRSEKSAELGANARAALCFWWNALERQVRVSGSVARIADAESAAYFATRPRGSQLGAWASAQSSVLRSRAELEQRHAELSARYPDAVPLPPHWGGFRLTPATFEFWQGRPSRLHDRLRYRRDDSGRWVVERLSP